MSTLSNQGGPNDGVDGSTASHDKNGVFGSNNDTTPRNAATPGGNGVFGFTQVPDGSGVFGAHNNGGVGVAGLGQVGVSGGNNADEHGVGVVGAGRAGDGVQGSTDNPHRNGVFGRNDSIKRRNASDPGGNGVFGFTQVPDGAGVLGAHSTGGVGVAGLADGSTGVGVSGFAKNGDGVKGTSQSSAKSGVVGMNESVSTARAPGGSGVLGVTTAPGGVGVFGSNTSVSPEVGAPARGRGVQGNGPEVGVGGFSESGVGILGQSNGGDGVQAFAASESHNAIFGRNTSTRSAPTGGSPAGNGVFGFTDVPNASGVVGASGPNSSVDPNSHLGGAGVTGIGKLAGQFFGDVTITGDLFLPGADCAEQFYVTGQAAEPGTVMVIGDGETLHVAESPYDSRVAGVVAGGGQYKPGVILNSMLGTRHPRMPLSLIGRAFCKVDAAYGPIRIGDMLTTSPTPGHAMVARDTEKAFGAVIGKALRSVEAGKDMIPILIALQ